MTSGRPDPAVAVGGGPVSMEEQGSGVGLLFPTMPDMVVHGDYLHGHGHGRVSQTRGRERK